MADYQSLLTRAVANLPSASSAAARQAIYDRARKALLAQLRTLRPPLPESDITREENALNQAIAQVEAKFGGTDAAHAEPTPAKTASSAASHPASEKPAAAAPPRAAPASQTSTSAPMPQAQNAPGSLARAAAPAASTSPALRPPPIAPAQPRPDAARTPAPASAQHDAPTVPVRAPQAPALGSVNRPETRAFLGAVEAPTLRADRASRPGDTASSAASASVPPARTLRASPVTPSPKASSSWIFDRLANARTPPCSPFQPFGDNLRKALAQVRRNKGAAGVDGVSVEALSAHLKDHRPTIRARLLDGSYEPQPVRRVEIPKPGGGVRPLGVPTVLDRAAPVVAAKTEGPSPASSKLANVVPSAETHAGGSGAPPVVARIEDGAELGSAPEVRGRASGCADRPPVWPKVPLGCRESSYGFRPSRSAHQAVSAALDDDRLAPRLEPEGQRPQAPTEPAERSKSWLWLALAVVLGAVLSVAAAAIVMRQKPQDLAIAPPQAHQKASTQPPAKIAQRVQPSPTENNSTAPAASEPQGGQTTAQNGQEPANLTPAADNGTSPGAARAAILVASPDNPQKPVVNLGSTVWSIVPPAPAQPATIAVKADADIPDLKMLASMTLRKNTDPTLQATHTIELKFSFADGAPIAGFKDVGAPQMRKLDSTASEPLISVKVKVSDVYFLIALAKGDQDTARNLDLMQTRAWFDFPLLLNDNRIAKLVFQKSSEGEAMLAKAFDAWK